MTKQPADLLQRFFAWIIDIILILIITNVMFLIIKPMKIWNLPFAYIDPLYWWITNSLQFTVGFFYYWLLESFNKGQTLGKIVLKLSSVDEISLNISTPRNYALNSIFKGSWLLIVDLIIGFFISYDDENKKIRIMQNISKIIVVKES